MKHRIEKEIDQTLSCLKGLDDIEISPDFIDNVTGRMGQLPPSGQFAAQNRLFYPAAIVVLIIVNVSMLIGTFSSTKNNTTAIDQTGIIAAEYGMGQSSITAY